MGVLVGIDIGHRHLSAAVANLEGVILSEDRCAISVDDCPSAALEWIERAFQALLDTTGFTPGDIHAIGVAIPAPTVKGTVIATPFLPGWEGIDVVAELRKLADAPLFIENDANAAAVAEARANRPVPGDVTNHLHIKISTGVGAGLVADGTLVRGDRGQAGEIGHLVVDPGGPLCRCGNRGCLEVLASVPAVLRALATVYPTPVTIDNLSTLLHHGDAAARRAMRDAGEAVGEAIAPMVAAVGATRISVGGTATIPLDDLIEGIQTKVTSRVHRDVAEGLSIFAGTFGARSEIVGAIQIAAISAQVAARKSAT